MYNTPEGFIENPASAANVIHNETKRNKASLVKTGFVEWTRLKNNGGYCFIKFLSASFHPRSLYVFSSGRTDCLTEGWKLSTNLPALLIWKIPAENHIILFPSVTLPALTSVVPHSLNNFRVI
jgi:hypothetical protein